MSGGKPVVLVLWGNYFDECAATAFICELRAAGVRVRVVGIDGRNARGRHGLMLGTDISLEKALAFHEPVSYVVLPCHQGQWVQLLGQPQMWQWLERLAVAGAILLMGETILKEYQEHQLHAGVYQVTNLALPLESLHSWPGGAEVAPYARELANSLRYC